MKHAISVLLVVTVCVCGAGCTTGRGHSRITDRLELTQMEFFSADPQVKMQDVWRVEDGVHVLHLNLRVC